MEQDFQTSFIPKKPMIEHRAVSARPVSPITIIASLILFTVVIASGGLYFYKGIMEKNIAKMKSDLELSKGRFEQSKIIQLQTLDRRLRASSEILSKHITVSPIFETLQAITLKSVRYTKFDYNIDDKAETVTVKMGGQATGYRAIALQSDLFTENNKKFIDPVFSNLSLDEKGNVNFNLEFSVDPSFVNYKKAVLEKNAEMSDLFPEETVTEN
jgi:hypothetical protein